MVLSEADCCYIDSLCCYCEGDLLEALFHLCEGLSADPDHAKSKLLQTKLKRLITAKTDGEFHFQA